MAVCNLFKAFTKPTGNFLLFSQYAEDLSRMTADGSHYRVVPSKFVAMKLNWDPADKQNIVKLYGNPNAWLPLYLQNYFENGLAILREKSEQIQTRDGQKFIYSADVSKWLFWKALFDANYLNMSASDNAVLEVKYVGDINLQSYDQWSGMGYSEIYCYIPNDATAHRYTMSRKAPQNALTVSASAGEYLHGFTENDTLTVDENNEPAYNTNASELQLLKSINYTYEQIYEFAWEEQTKEEKAKKIEPLPVLEGNLDEDEFDNKSFEFNTIVVLYDVMTLNNDGSWDAMHTDIPMGMYVCGVLGGTEDVAGWEIMTNTFRKFVANDDIYGSGTSYGLRICSRYLVNPNNDTIKNIDIHATDEGYAEFSRVMSSFADMQSKMDDIMNGVLQNAEVNKDLLGIFKNSRTNVPYLKEVEGKKHWFVNGRDLGEAGDGGGHNGCENVWWGEDVQQRLDELEETLENNLRIIGHLEYGDGNTSTGIEIVDGIVEYKENQEPIDVVVKWTVTFKGHDIYPDEQSINNKPISPILRQYIFPGVSEDYKYAIKAIWGQYRALLTLPLRFVIPTFYGCTAYTQAELENGGEKLILDMVGGKANGREAHIKDTLSKSLILEPLLEFYQDQHYQRALVAIPKAYGKFTRIYDPDFRAFNYLNDFDVFDMSIQGKDYWIYLAKQAVTVENFHYKFDTSLPVDDGDY